MAKIAAENPAAIFINGDITWHGIMDDYAVYVMIRLKDFESGHPMQWQTRDRFDLNLRP